MERDQHLKNILKDNSIENAPKMFSHNLMAEIYKADVLSKELKKPLIKGYFWIVLSAALAAFVTGLLMYFPLHGGKYATKLTSIFSQFSESISAINSTYMLILAGILLLLFTELMLRRSFGFNRN